MRYARRILIAATLFGTGAGAAFAQQAGFCAVQADGTCGGLCPRESPICAKTPAHHCACTGSPILEPYTEPQLIPDQLLSAHFNATLVGSGGGEGWLRVGNSISFTQASSVTVLIKHSQAWGGGVEYVSVPSGILSFVVRITRVDDIDPNRLWFTLTSLSATLPSFSSVALGGGQTGDNTFSELNSQTAGWVDKTTGHFEVNVYAKYFNDIFCSAPALVQGRFEGTFDRVNHHTDVDYSLGSISMISDSPSENPPF